MTRKLRSVLLIDDDDITNYLHQMLIEELDVANHIEMVSDGETGLNRLKELCSLDLQQAQCPELVLLDLNMPRMDGFDFLEEFQAMNLSSELPIAIIVLTSSSNLQDMQKAQSYPINGYINKPLTSTKLQEILSQIS